MPKGKRKFPREWLDVIRNAKIKRSAMASALIISPMKLSNIYSGVVFCPFDIYNEIKSIVEKIKNGVPAGDILKPRHGDKSSFGGRISKIICRICGKRFEPWSEEPNYLPPVEICRNCFEMRDHVRKNKLEIKKEEFIRTEFYYWER